MACTSGVAASFGSLSLGSCFSLGSLWVGPAGSGPARQTGGVGLGLPLARRIVLAHGGDIEIRSEAGVGTAMTVCLPVR